MNPHPVRLEPLTSFSNGTNSMSIFRRDPVDDNQSEDGSGSERQRWSQANPNNVLSNGFTDTDAESKARREQSSVSERQWATTNQPPSTRNQMNNRVHVMNVAGSTKNPPDANRNVTVAGSGTNNQQQSNTGFQKIKFFDYNFYATKKGVQSALLDVALLMSNASQLKSVITLGTDYDFYWPMLIMLSLSVILQIVIGSVIILLSRVNINDSDDGEHEWADRLNNFVVIAIFVLTVLNIFIAAIGISVKNSYNPTTPK